MHLKRIQLMGFKSFVDATSIPVLSHMNAIVGPNGCGKSNVVDAIRWVTGETSAKQLRGQSMSDVIFNGTSSRKPLGKAAVELTFDNSDARITGEYAGFSEISIRREVVRDGQSSYYINGVSARRRDLVDLFLGTGLGPRSYAIIEQGMIAQLVEAKPEDLRSHFEEVAGVSKYRERRRETENRMRHTTENLDRLNDLREELNKQLRHLKRQSNAAERYKQLKEEERLVRAQIQVLQLQAYDVELASFNHKLSTLEVTQEENRAKYQAAETTLEKSRQDALCLADKKEEVQRQYYGLGAEVAKLEQAIAHKQDQIKQWAQELEESESFWKELQSRVEEHEEKLAQSRELKASFEPKSEAYENAFLTISDELSQAKVQLEMAQEAFESFKTQVGDDTRALEVARTDAAHYNRQLAQLNEKRDTLMQRLEAIPLFEHQESILPIQEALSQLNTQKLEIETLLEQVISDIQSQREKCQQYHVQLSDSNGELQKLEAQKASLEALQHAAITDNQSDIAPWLDDKSLSNAPRLGQKIGAKAGWELAVEVLLHDCFDALCVDDIKQHANDINGLEKGKVTLLAASTVPTSDNSSKRVIDIVENPSFCPLHLAGVYIAETLVDALNRQDSLQDNESIITQEGVWVGKNWVRVSRQTQAETGFLSREKTIKVLAEDIAFKQTVVSEQEVQLNQARSQLESLETSREQHHQQHQIISASLAEKQALLSRKEAELSSMTAEQARIKDELLSIEQQLDKQKTAALNAESIITQHESRQHASQEELAELQAQKEEASFRFEEIRQQAQEKKQVLDELAIQISATHNQENLLTETIESNKRQLQQLVYRRETLVSQLKEAESPIPQWQEALVEKLEARVTVETALQETDTALQNCQAQLRKGEQERQELQTAMNTIQSELQSMQMEKQTVTVRRATIQEQLDSNECEVDEIKASLPQEANIPDWESQSQQLKQKIDRLGPINLAAIDEYQSVSERKTYLDEQHQDLEEALAVLESAIQKIDRETRNLFRETFDKVNAGFQRLFPRIFGGGQAALSLTDDNLLTTGIAVRAQPPGKRNSTIHMLSGGEKTLTAIALMFAMFELNPAPFCVLDEVDAPLDDLNVGRFCQLVKEMSKSTQFLVISHNKVTIEMADHLMGVTMQEPGVSRIVSVDMQAAVALVDE